MHRRDGYNPRWPVEPFAERISVRYKTLPSGYPTERVTAGPTSMKHIYPASSKTGAGSRANYPTSTLTRPINSLYGADFSQFDANGARETYHFKAYPPTHRYVREVVTKAPVSSYAGLMSWTRRSPVKTGQSLD